MKKKLINYIYSLLILIITIYFFINSNNTVNEFKEITKNVITIILPSLFPFMIFINFILYSNCIDYLSMIFSKIFKFLKVSGYGICCIISSIIGGYPFGAILLSTFVKENKININEANKLLYCTFFPSISFIIISLFNKDRITIFIMLSIYLASFLSLLFVNNNQKNSNEIIINNDFTSTYFNVFNSSIKSIFSIYFSILFFTMISKILTNNINNIYLNYFISGIFEFSLPSINLVNEINITFIHYILLTFILSFSSLSIIYQSMFYLKDIKISIKKLLLTRITISILSIIIFSIIYFFIRILT